MKTIYRYAAGPGEEIRETVRQTDLYEYYKMVNAFLGDVRGCTCRITRYYRQSGK